MIILRRTFQSNNPTRPYDHSQKLQIQSYIYLAID